MSAVYRAIAFTTALLCVVSFANAESVSPQPSKQVTHFFGGDEAICARFELDDVESITYPDVVSVVTPTQFTAVPQQVLPALQQCFTLHDIRGPPATKSLI
ncbi:hypothetical protein [Pseudohongiella sp.]|uniref:hypothetical protein n=1 Tax=Pseudohongiella sp. TaxID=1979412 RepID=UPI001843AD73|nr:hypothetical protein [Pseudohongiella sp.]HDZ07922.1 hypothetical protein [Pseudohongiella sp.]HEA64471.1 hypothetical protein [Pseudohongiella sp.]